MRLIYRCQIKEKWKEKREKKKEEEKMNERKKALEWAETILFYIVSMHNGKYQFQIATICTHHRPTTII